MSLVHPFWSSLWQCAHRHPCKKCCWPSRRIDVTLNWKYVWYASATVLDSALAPPRHVFAYRFAYELTHGRLLSYGRALHLCHQCHFRPCCNPSHLCPASLSDNAKDRQYARRYRSIRLPDGRHWSYADACAKQNAFQDARSYLRVFAGPIPPRFQWLESDLTTPRVHPKYRSLLPPLYQ